MCVTEEKTEAQRRIKCAQSHYLPQGQSFKLFLSSYSYHTQILIGRITSSVLEKQLSSCGLLFLSST